MTKTVTQEVCGLYLIGRLRAKDEITKVIRKTKTPNRIDKQVVTNHNRSEKGPELTSRLKPIKTTI